MAQNAIEKAENGDYSEVNDLLEKLISPYDEEIEELHDYTLLPPRWSLDICVTCSS